MKFVKSCVPVLLLACLATACAVQTDPASTHEATAETSSAIRTQDYEKIYFTDATFTTEVGSYYLSCGNAPPMRRGRVTSYYIGTSSACEGTAPPSRTCYALEVTIDGNGEPQNGVTPVDCPY